MTRDRVKEKFDAIRKENRPGLLPYLTTGFPDLQATLELIPALAEAGADGIEFSIPFSDPLADGPVIQESSHLALQGGITPDDCLDMVAQVRDQVPDTPLVLMTYYNPIYTYGLTRFAQRLSDCGIDAVIPVDLPAEEAGPLYEECRPHNIHIVPLLAPTSTEESIKTAVGISSGFIYCVQPDGHHGSARPGVPVGDRTCPASEKPYRSSPVPGIWHFPARTRGSGVPGGRGRRGG